MPRENDMSTITIEASTSLSLLDVIRNDIKRRGFEKYEPSDMRFRTFLFAEISSEIKERNVEGVLKKVSRRKFSLRAGKTA